MQVVRLLLLRRDAKMTFPLLTAKLQTLRPGQVKEAWLADVCNKLDTKIFKEIILTHEHSPHVKRPHYTVKDVTTDRKLLAEDGYDDVYMWWCCMEIDLQYGDMNRYAVSRSLFNDAYTDMAARWTRTHMPLSATDDDTGSVHPVLGVLV